MQLSLFINITIIQAAVALYFRCAEFSALPETDGATRMLYHYIALGPRGVQDRMYYRDINDTEAEHLPEDIVAHLRERREDTAVAVDRSAATKYLKIFLRKYFHFLKLQVEFINL